MLAPNEYELLQVADRRIAEWRRPSLNRSDELLTFKETVTTLAGASRSCANWKRHCARCARKERQSHAGLSGGNILKHGNARLSALSIVDSKEPPRL